LVNLQSHILSWVHGWICEDTKISKNVIPKCMVWWMLYRELAVYNLKILNINDDEEVVSKLKTLLYRKDRYQCGLCMQWHPNECVKLHINSDLSTIKSEHEATISIKEVIASGLYQIMC